MSQIIQNGSHLQKQATFTKKQLDLLKWVRFEEVGHTRKMGYVFKKSFTIEKLVRFNKIDHIWRNVCSRLKKFVKL